MQVEWIGYSKLTVVNKCGQLFVCPCLACDVLVFCPGCNPTLTLKIVGKVSRTPTRLSTGQTMWENRLWWWWWWWCELQRRTVKAQVLKASFYTAILVVFLTWIVVLKSFFDDFDWPALGWVASLTTALLMNTPVHYLCPLCLFVPFLAACFSHFVFSTPKGADVDVWSLVGKQFAFSEDYLI